MTDEEVINTLQQVKGIGRWTAEMFLIFCLGRLFTLQILDSFKRGI
jgi:DNA-3-methyladenine glycosylase II